MAAVMESARGDSARWGLEGLSSLGPGAIRSTRTGLIAQLARTAVGDSSLTCRGGTVSSNADDLSHASGAVVQAGEIVRVAR
jgi:hypothetical protein